MSTKKQFALSLTTAGVLFLKEAHAYVRATNILIHGTLWKGNLVDFYLIARVGIVSKSDTTGKPVQY